VSNARDMKYSFIRNRIHKSTDGKCEITKLKKKKINKTTKRHEYVGPKRPKLLLDTNQKS